MASVSQKNSKSTSLYSRGIERNIMNLSTFSQNFKTPCLKEFLLLHVYDDELPTNVCVSIVDFQPISEAHALRYAPWWIHVGGKKVPSLPAVDLKQDNHDQSIHEKMLLYPQVKTNLELVSIYYSFA